jgi:phenylpyruvate tautomerase PptA (4-oxalocrotonate tautomerase family)
MPLVRISLRKGKPAAYRQKIADNVYRALRETFNVPDEDRFIVIDEYDADNLIFSKTYMDIPRSDDFIVLQLAVSNTRSVAQKQALYKRIVERLQSEAGVRPEDVFINLVEVDVSDWSFGRGFAQYVTAT